MTAIDTNILVYAFDNAEPSKRKICSELLHKIFEGKQTAVVTTQILAEFASAVTKKIEKPISKDDAKAIIGAILSSKNWKVINYKGSTILHALESKQPFWDSLIAQTLKEHNIQELITENVSDFKNSGIKPVTPF